MFPLKTCDLRKLNSITKYPSIPTYHKMDKGVLSDEHIGLPEEMKLFVTEKVDGTNSRIILTPDGVSWLIGSREELLTARCDLIHIPTMGIVDALRFVPDSPGVKSLRSREQWKPAKKNGKAPLIVLYLETYGGKIGRAAKQYTSNCSFGYRLFDIAFIHDWQRVFEFPLEKISLWREEGGQEFLSENELSWASEELGLELTSRLDVDSCDIPESHQGVLDWLTNILPKTKVAMDENAGSQPEGVVVRSFFRTTIFKIRYEDYQKTLKRK